MNHQPKEHAMTTEFPSLAAFYAADPRRERSPEADYGVHWTDRRGASLSSRTRWRVSYVQATGEVYAVRQGTAVRWGQMVRILGIVPADEVTRPRDEVYYRTLDAVLDGWADPEVSGFDLAWAARQIAAWSPPQWQQVTCARCERTWRCCPDDDYFSAAGTPPPADLTSGVCFGCMLEAAGMDPETTGVLVLDENLAEIDPRDGPGPR